MTNQNGARRKPRVRKETIRALDTRTLPAADLAQVAGGWGKKPYTGECITSC